MSSGKREPALAETHKVVEQILSRDPGGVYADMDAHTRALYGDAVHAISGRSPYWEGEIARLAVKLAAEAAAVKGKNDRAAHVGFYLMGQGYAGLERAAHAEKSAARMLQTMVKRGAIFLYLGFITVMTAGLAAAILILSHSEQLRVWSFALAAASSLLCASQFAVLVANWLVAFLAPPRRLPRMDFSAGVPPAMRTLVTVPCFLSNPQVVHDLLAALETHYLRNNDPNIYFSLLTDFCDSKQEINPRDELLLRQAQNGIVALNQKYRRGKNPIFFLFHRPRRWNHHEKLWMGHERKRGKLAELHSLLRAGTSHCFSLIVGDTSILQSIRYVVTVDADTELPRDAIRPLIATMAHPLNAPEFDDEQKCVREGYGILQPRMIAKPASGAQRSIFTELYWSEPPIDSRSSIAADVYQDLFDNGTFVGKGIYDLDIFIKCMKGRIPENRVISHDHLEGFYARSGLVSDIIFFEQYPSSYAAEAARRRRWIRGDWQNACWLLPHVRGPQDVLHKNPITLLSRWKIIDNLRRSLLQLGTTLFLIMSWMFWWPAWLGSVFLAGINGFPLVLKLIMDLLRKPSPQRRADQLHAALQSFAREAGKLGFWMVSLPYDAVFSLQTILSAVWRRFFTHQRLLEWTTAEDSENIAPVDLWSTYKSMWAAPAISLGTLSCLAFLRPEALPAASPVLALWFVSPLVAWCMRLPLTSWQGHAIPLLRSLRHASRSYKKILNGRLLKGHMIAEEFDDRAGI